MGGIDRGEGPIGIHQKARSGGGPPTCGSGDREALGYLLGKKFSGIVGHLKGKPDHPARAVSDFERREVAVAWFGVKPYKGMRETGFQRLPKLWGESAGFLSSIHSCAPFDAE